MAQPNHDRRVRREVTAASGTEPTPRGNVRSGSAERAGEDERQPVQTHRVDRGGGAPDAEVERQDLGGLLEPLGVVDGAGRDGAVPVVGADDLPADGGGPVGDCAGQAGDAGVVVDLDVDLAALARQEPAWASPGSASWSARGVVLGSASRATVVTSRSVGSPPRVATKAIAAIATAITLSITTGDGRTTPPRWLRTRWVTRRSRVLDTTLRPRSRAGARSADAGARSAAGAAGGPAAGRPRGPRAGRSAR